MVFCTYCGQSFTRDEHLERHILTHTNVKPFKCFTCHMSFARRDLLQRHYTVHGRDQNNQEGLPPSNGIIPKPSGRTPIACNNCAKTKTKCDKKFPCSRCAGRNLRCTLRPTRRQSKNALRNPGDGQANPNTDSSEQSTTDSRNHSNGSSPQSHAPVDIRPQASTLGSKVEETSPKVPTAAVENSSDEPSVSLTATYTLPYMSSPLATSANLIDSTSIPGYDDFNHTGDYVIDDRLSPRYMADWGEASLASEFFSGSGFHELAMPPATDFAFWSVPEVSILSDLHAGPEVSTGPMPRTPMPGGSLPELGIGSSAAILHPPLRHASISETSSTDIAAVTTALDSWNCFRCNPVVSPALCPKTARLNLEKLEQTLRDHEAWSQWEPSWETTDESSAGHLLVLPLHESTRDKLLAITQSFLHKALDIHRDDGTYSPGGDLSPFAASSNFVLLPPARVLESFLMSYVDSFERYFPMTPKGVLDPNEIMMNCFNDRAASLLVLMMIAQGATALPSAEGRWLTGGLTEACRISLFDLIEKNVTMAGDSTVLHSALLFTAQAAWSGDKWHMDIAMGQRGMYIAMLRHHGMLEPHHVLTPPMHSNGFTDGLWNDWIRQETKSRVIYSWAIVDQDISLFHDTASLFSVTELGAPMPDTDRLWSATSAAEWLTFFNETNPHSPGYQSTGSGSRPLCLRDVFRLFLADEVASQGIEMTAMQLRLLLHPLQSMVSQYRQLVSCLPEMNAKGSRSKPVTAVSTRTRLEEVQSLLHRWYGLARGCIKDQPMCARMQANMVIFHLISLNAVADFPEIERLARRENYDGSYEQLLWLHKKCISNVEEAVFHCGQVLGLIKAMPHIIRPPWWAGAIYRASLVLWTESLTYTDAMEPSSTCRAASGPTVPVDALAAEHPLIVGYLTEREGVPTLTNRDGSQVLINHGFTVLSVCVDIIDQGVPTLFSAGIRSKLQRLAQG